LLQGKEAQQEHPMPFLAFSENFRKVTSVLRKDGIKALFNVVYYKLVTSLGWRVRNLLGKLNVLTQDEPGMLKARLVLFCSVPYDDVGGGQRSAQLTRAALRTGMKVMYVYIYPKYDFMQRRNVTSRVNLPNLIHVPIRFFSLEEFTRFINGKTSIIFELPHPSFEKYLEIAGRKGIRSVFELIDDWSTSLGGDWFHEDVFQKFVHGCDLVTGTSRSLVNRLVAMGRQDALYLPNAANEYVFNRSTNYPRPADLPEGKYALYFGSLYGEWFGWEYVREAAGANRDLNFCLIGSKPQEIPGQLPANVYFLGEKRIDQLPAYLSWAEFCLLPFAPSQLTEAVSPIKAYEYLFMAKRVVSTSLAEVKDLPNVHVARDEGEFADLCTHLKNAHSQIKSDGDSIDDVLTFIAKNSWFSRLQNIIGLQGESNVSVIILIHNNRQIIGRCLESLLMHCGSYLREVIVVDNASQDGGAEFVKLNFPQVRLLKNPVNGCSSGRNLGVKASSGQFLAFVDSDQWFTGGFCFEEALSILTAHPDIGAVGWAAGWLELERGQIHGSTADYYPRRGVSAGAALRGFRTDITYLGTGGLFLSRSVFDAAGGLDPAYDPTCFEDTDLSFSIKKLGYQLAYRDLSCIRHESHQTTTASEASVAYQELYARNSAYFLEKWKEHRRFFVRFSL
jgi:GT2 family glycosyltransferase